MPPGGRRVRRDGQHGAEAEGRRRAQAQVGAGWGGPALGARVARGVRGASRGRARRRLGDGRRRGEDARALMDAFGVELLEPAGLDLTPGRVERARADGGEAPLAE